MRSLWLPLCAVLLVGVPGTLTLKGVGVPAAGHHKPDVPLLPET